ncbi:ATP:Cob(I)alamin adenosyltransferase [hydrothermal vent metagenome]|uniref:ATP:Cob(I)alamin adenosyltransferase n=1 Tax=hydrothermal vent metagenome TaxID=652676 RepID=A0A3B1AG75_9ZZZZ
MGNRLSKIYTRTGDDGSTALGDGSRVDKDCDRVEAFGTIDELNSVIGMILSHQIPEAISTLLSRLQHELFDLGGELCIPGHNIINPEHVRQLENDLDNLNLELPALKEFILPAGGKATSCCHLARTVCRRAERVIVCLAKTQNINLELRAYVNRLSDFLFVLARTLARYENGQEVLWRPHNKK